MTGLSGQLLAKEVSDQRGDHRSVFFQGEVARIEQMELQVLEVTLVGIRSRSREDRIVLAPDDQRGRLVLAEILLPLGIQRRIAAVAVEQGQLNLLIAGTVQERLHMTPSVRADRFDVANTVGVLPLGRIERQQRSQLVALFLGAVLPVRLDRFPEVVVDPFVVGVAVLHDQCFDSLRVLDGEPKTDRRSVVHQVDRILLQTRPSR